MEDIKIEDELVVDIIDINSEGRGVGRYNNFTFFIDGGTIGDKVKFRVKEIKKSFGLGEVVEILEPSPYRVESKCSYFPECDGCQLHNLDYKRQLEFKRDMVQNDLERIGKIADIEVNEVLGMENPYRYRNKADFKVGKDDKIGYFKRESHNLIPIDKCIIQDEIVDEIIDLVKQYMKEWEVAGYDKKTKKGIIKNLLVRTTKDNKAMVVIVTKKSRLPRQEELIKILTSNENIVSIYQNIQPDDRSILLGEKDVHLYGEEKLIDSIGEYKFLISPKSFFQVNPYQTEILYNKVVEFLDLKGNETVVDLYCGIGTIGIYLSKYAKRVYGVETVRQAIDDGKENLKLNGIENMEFIKGRSQDILPKFNDQEVKIDALIVDPPRKGLDKGLIDTIEQGSPEKIVYVSCNPATLSRDLKYLGEKGYKVKEVQPVDMFGMTTHIEVVTLLIKEDQ